MKLRHKFWASGSFFLADWNVLRSAHWSVYWVLLVLPQNAAFEYFEYAKQLAVDQHSYTPSSLYQRAPKVWDFFQVVCLVFQKLSPFIHSGR